MNSTTLINSGKTVFSIADMAFLLDMQDIQSIRNYASRLGKEGLLQSLAYGIRGLQRYNTYELASKLKKKSYISLETVLYSHGIIYQDYGQTITSISDNTITKTAKGHTYIYKKITSKILFEPLGIEHKNHYSIASPERAVCDKLYLSPLASFDNMEHISRDKLYQIAQIYPRRVRLSLDQLFHHAS